MLVGHQGLLVSSMRLALRAALRTFKIAPGNFVEATGVLTLKTPQKKAPMKGLYLFGGPSGIRTLDQEIKSLLLYQLS
jgi:hypothetical protein